MWSAIPVTLVLIWVLSRTKIRTNGYSLLVLLFGSKLLAEIFEALKFSDPGGERIWYRLSFPFTIVVPALIYLFFEACITGREIKLAQVPRWHWAPFALGWLYYFGFLLFAPPQYFAYTQTLLWNRYLEVVGRVLVGAPYMVAIFSMFRNYSRKLESISSNVGRAQLFWLKWMWGVSILSFGISLIDVLTGPDLPFWLADVVVVYVAMLGLILVGLSTSRIFEGCEIHDEAHQFAPPNLEDLKTKFEEFMIGKRMYRMPRLRLDDLSEVMDIRPQKISDILRFGYGKSFYDFVNQLRVKDAMKQIDSAPDEKLLSIALDSGFSSKSTFNEVFRKTTGMTPSEYRRRKNWSEEARLDDFA